MPASRPKWQKINKIKIQNFALVSDKVHYQNPKRNNQCLLGYMILKRNEFNKTSD